MSRFKSSVFFLGPSLLLILLFFFLPAVLTALLSFTSMDYTFRWNFVGFANYTHFLSDFLIKKVLLNTFIYVFLTLACFNVGFGLFLALLTTHIPERIGIAFRAIWLLPRMTPSVIYALLWRFFLDPSSFGFLNVIRKRLLNLPEVDIVGVYPWFIIVLVNGFIGASMGMVIFTSAIKSIPEDYIRAAKVDGASGLQIVRRITLPLIKWPLMFITVYQTLSLLTSFEYILLVTDGGPFYRTEVWALYTYHRAFQNYEFGYAAALAFTLVIIGLIASLFYWKFFNLEKMLQPAKIEVS